MVIDYPADGKLVLRVRDTGTLDHFDVFVNGTLRRKIADGELHEFPITRPTKGTVAIAVHFEGIDGGKSAVIDIADDDNPTTLSSQAGRIHSYLLKVTP